MGCVTVADLTVESAQLMADALLEAAERKVSGCEAAKRLEQPFLTLAAAVNDTLSSATANVLEDNTFGSGLMLATDSPGHNSQPDVWGSGLAVQIGAGTEAQRERMAKALAANASNIFRWGQARHLVRPAHRTHPPSASGPATDLMSAACWNRSGRCAGRLRRRTAAS